MHVRAALRDLLESYQNLTLVGEASNGEEAVRLVKDLSPSVVVMDINMPKLNGIDATIRIKTSYPHVVIVGLSVRASDAHRRAMTAAGATRLISKYMAIEHCTWRFNRQLTDARRPATRFLYFPLTILGSS